MIRNPFIRILALLPAILLACRHGTGLLAMARVGDITIDLSLDAPGSEDERVENDKTESAVHRRAQATNPCPVCGAGGTLTRPTGVINTPQVFRSCQEVQNNPALIPPGFCESIQNSGIIAAECGCINPAQSCPVCGPSRTLTNPVGILDFAGVFGVCEAINNNQRIIPTGSCATVQGSTAVADTCGCVDTATLLSSVPSMSPTQTPAPSSLQPVSAFQFFLAALFEILARIFGF